MLVSVCTIARNEEEYLPHLLEDITKQDYPAEQIEVVMVDSSSTDGTRRIMERFAEENPQYLESPLWKTATVSPNAAVNTASVCGVREISGTVTMTPLPTVSTWRMTCRNTAVLPEPVTP